MIYEVCLLVCGERWWYILNVKHIAMKLVIQGYMKCRITFFVAWSLHFTFWCCPSFLHIEVSLKVSIPCTEADTVSRNVTFLKIVTSISILEIEWEIQKNCKKTDKMEKSVLLFLELEQLFYLK